MKRLILGGLSVLLLTAAGTPAVRAQPTTAINTATLSSTFNSGLTPFNLFYQAKRGYLKEQGIPSYGPLRVAYAQGLVTAQDIVAAGVKANLVEPKYLTDQTYISAVEVELRSFLSNN